MSTEPAGNVEVTRKKAAKHIRGGEEPEWTVMRDAALALEDVGFMRSFVAYGPNTMTFYLYHSELRGRSFQSTRMIIRRAVIQAGFSVLKDAYNPEELSLTVRTTIRRPRWDWINNAGPVGALGTHTEIHLPGEVIKALLRFGWLKVSRVDP